MLYFLSFLALALLLCAIYAVIVLLEVPGLAEERLGRLEPLPPLNEWIADEASAQAESARAEGLVREERVFRDAAGLSGRRLVHQVRYRDPRTDEIARGEPDRRYRRRRTAKAAASATRTARDP